MGEKDEELTFETLLKLRDEVGLKTYQQFEAEKFYGKNQQKSSKQKRKQAQDYDSDEPPVEISSKHPFKKNKPSHKWRTETRTIDPRFSDRVAGKFNEERFKKDFQFAFDLREEELKTLKEAQSKNEEAEEQEKRKYLIQRMENQKRESQKKHKQVQNKAVEVLKDGTKFYKTKKLQRTEDLVKKFIELKQSGQLEKHLDKRRKKLAGKERKKMNIEK